jgi:uncharacterized repeat protein (TIGR03803 family)
MTPHAKLTVPELRSACCGAVAERLFSFHFNKKGNAPHGAWPLAGLTADPSGDGVLYGTTWGGGSHGDGTVFKLTPSASGYVESVLYSSHGGSEGQFENAPLLVDSAGAVYGTTFGSGSSRSYCNCGIVYKLTPTGSTYAFSILHRFRGKRDGAITGTPQGLYRDSGGALYGTTWTGGEPKCNYGAGCGTVFKLTPTSSGTYTESILYRFQGGKDGWIPGSALIADSSGALYATTIFGGNAGAGTIFKLTPTRSGTYTKSTIHNFDGSDGMHPNSSLLADSSGDFFSVAGYLEPGEVYELTPSSSGSGYSFHVLFAFDNSYYGDGYRPQNVVFCSSAGSLCGTTEEGGRDSFGLAFKLTPTQNPKKPYVESILHKFSYDEAYPSAVTIDSSGALYGTSFGGSSSSTFRGGGIAFKISVPSDSSETSH